MKIIGQLFPCYVLLAKSCNVVSVLNFTIMLNNSSVLSSMAFCEIASALHSCYLLMPLVKTWTKIFKQKLSNWTWLRLSIRLITKLCYKRSNDMVGKAECFFGLHADYLRGGFGKCCLVTAPGYIGSSSGQPTWSSFICSLYWKVTACAWGEGSGCSYFGQAYLRPTFTPDYSKSKQTSIWT